MKRIRRVESVAMGMLNETPQDARAAKVACDGRSISVVLATYNGARFLPRQLDSLLAQILPPTELVVGDDQSSDATPDILAAFAASAPFPVRVTVNRERLHFGENFLQAAARSGGHYVAFCDQDDIWHPRKLERTLNAMLAHDAVLCGHDARLIDAAGRRTGSLKHVAGGIYPPLTLAPWGVFFGFTTMIRRDCLDAIAADRRGLDAVDPRRLLAHDRWAYFLGTTLGRTVYLAEPLADYRQHGQNAFGAGRGTGFAGLRRRLRTDVDALALHLALCRQRHLMLAAMGQHSFGDAGAAGAVYWERLSRIYEARLALARSRSCVGRGALLLRLLRLDAYAPAARGGLSPRALIRDALSAALPLRAGAEDPSR